jgi:hypothetical protein
MKHTPAFNLTKMWKRSVPRENTSELEQTQTTQDNVPDPIQQSAQTGDKYKQQDNGDLLVSLCSEKMIDREVFVPSL